MADRIGDASAMTDRLEEIKADLAKSKAGSALFPIDHVTWLITEVTRLRVENDNKQVAIDG